jgi:hypothetical protein
VRYGVGAGANKAPSCETAAKAAAVSLLMGFRKNLHFDDPVDYEAGETPMTVLQFQSFVALFRETKDLEEKLEAERRKKS